MHVQYMHSNTEKHMNMHIHKFNTYWSYAYDMHIPNLIRYGKYRSRLSIISKAMTNRRPPRCLLELALIQWPAYSMPGMERACSTTNYSRLNRLCRRWPRMPWRTVKQATQQIFDTATSLPMGPMAKTPKTWHGVLWSSTATLQST